MLLTLFHLCPILTRFYVLVRILNEFELELIQSHMVQKPMLRGEEGARRTRNRQSRH